MRSNNEISNDNAHLKNKNENRNEKDTFDLVGGIASDIGSGLGKMGVIAKSVDSALPSSIKKIGKIAKIVGEAAKDPSPNWIENVACGASKVIIQGAAGGGIVLKGAVEGANAVPSLNPYAKLAGAATGTYAAGKLVGEAVEQIGNEVKKVCHSAFDYVKTLNKLNTKSNEESKQEQDQNQDLLNYYSSLFILGTSIEAVHKQKITKLSRAETEIFLNNLKTFMNEEWLSLNRIADQGYLMEKSNPNNTKNLSQLTKFSKRSNLFNSINSFKKGSRATLESVKKIADILEISYESLLSQPTGKPKIINKAGMDFIQHAIRKGYDINRLSNHTEIHINLLRKIINRGVGKFNENQVNQLIGEKFNFPLQTIAPFLPKNINAYQLVQAHVPKLILYNSNYSPEILSWIYQRKAISQIAMDKKIDINKLSEITQLSKQFLDNNLTWRNSTSKKSENLTNHFNRRIHFEKEINHVKTILGIEKINKDHLAVMGKYSMTTSQFNEFLKCEKLFNHYTKKIIEAQANTTTIKPKMRLAITSEDIYKFYLGMKQYYYSTGISFPEIISKIVKDISWTKVVLIGTAILSSLLKSLPVVAAEIAADYGVNILDQNANQTEYLINKLIYTIGSHNLKFIFLIPKSFDAALKTPFPKKSNFIYSLLQLPVNMVARFIEAEGYSNEIVEDWKVMTDTLLQLAGIKESNIKIKQMKGDDNNIFSDSNLTNRHQKFSIFNGDNNRNNNNNSAIHTNRITHTINKTESIKSANNIHNANDNQNILNNLNNCIATNSIQHNTDNSEQHNTIRKTEHYQKQKIHFSANGKQHTMDVIPGLTIYTGPTVGTLNNPVIASYCEQGKCAIDLKIADNAHQQIILSYQSENNSAPSQRKTATETTNVMTKTNNGTNTNSYFDERANTRIENLQNHVVKLQQASPYFPSTSNSIVSASSHAFSSPQHLENLQASQQNFDRTIASLRCNDYSQFTNQHRQTYYFDTASEAARYNTFFSNYIHGNFMEKPKPVESPHSFSFWGGGNNGGKSGICDSRYQNCGSSSSNDCRSGGSDRCSSSLF